MTSDILIDPDTLEKLKRADIIVEGLRYELVTRDEGGVLRAVLEPTVGGPSDPDPPPKKG